MQMKKLFANRLFCCCILWTLKIFIAGLRHELSSLARTVGSWIRISLKAWMFGVCVCVCVCVCVYSVFVLSCV
jgi:hypothetical protein